MNHETQLVLELQTGAHPIAGRLRDEHGVLVNFCGWIELAAALEQLLRPHDTRPRPDGRTDTDQQERRQP